MGDYTSEENEENYERFSKPRTSVSKWLSRGYTTIIIAGLVAGAGVAAKNHFVGEPGIDEQAVASELQQTYQDQIVLQAGESISEWTWKAAAHDSDTQTFTALITTEGSSVAQGRTYEVETLDGTPKLHLIGTCDILPEYVESHITGKGASSFSPIHQAVTKTEGEKVGDVICQDVAGTDRLVVLKGVKPSQKSVIFDTQKNRSAGKFGL